MELRRHRSGLMLRVPERKLGENLVLETLTGFVVAKGKEPAPQPIEAPMFVIDDKPRSF